MTIPDNEQLREWLGNPSTIFFFNQIKEAVDEAKDRKLYVQGEQADVLGLKCAYRDGVVEGLEEVLNIREEFKE